MDFSNIFHANYNGPARDVKARLSSHFCTLAKVIVESVPTVYHEDFISTLSGVFDGAILAVEGVEQKQVQKAQSTPRAIRAREKAKESTK